LVTDKDAKEDIQLFFQNPDHWAYRYGSPTPGCNPNSPYHRKQIEVIFEDKYFHWVTNRAVDELIDEGFLKLQKRGSAHFVYLADVGATENDIDMRIKVIEKYSDPAIVRGIGAYAELLYQFLFRVGGFKIVGENTNEYAGRKWVKTNHNFDYIVEKGTVACGVEIKNTLNYMENDEFEIKLEMCEFLGLTPFWIVRNAPKTQFEKMSSMGAPFSCSRHRSIRRLGNHSSKRFGRLYAFRLWYGEKSQKRPKNAFLSL